MTSSGLMFKKHIRLLVAGDVRTPEETQEESERHEDVDKMEGGRA